MDIEQSDDVKYQTDTTEKQKKKKPGRPRKTPIREPRVRIGIVQQPKDCSNYMEFLYDKPLLFRKIWQYFKLMSVDKLQIIFRRNDVIMWCTDHHKKSRMLIKINPNNLNHYYCPEDLDIGLSCKNPEIIMSKIDKTYTNILFLSKIGNNQRDIRIILNNEIEIDESHKIELIGEYDKLEDENLYTNTEYMIKFELPCRYFKKMISDIKSFSDQMTIRQDGISEPLVFEYTTSDKKIKSYHVVRNNKNIKFVSHLTGNDTFRVSFKLDYIKPLSSSVLSENITIYAHENKPLLFKVTMDKGTLELNVLTDIIDERNII